MNTNQKRKYRKDLLVTFLGGKCIRCGWAEHSCGLTAHHVNPSKKSFELGSSNLGRKWSSIEEEARKCLLMCFNCHQIIHTLNELYYFDEQSIPLYKSLCLEDELCEKCLKPYITSHYPDEKCGSGIEWLDLKDLVDMINQKGYKQTAKTLNISDNAIRYHIKINGLNPKDLGRRRGIKYSS